jgi:hypothetical protein
MSVVVLPGAGDPAALGMTIEKRQKAEQTMPLYTTLQVHRRFAVITYDSRPRNSST